jgi:ABC-2 type transport system permease protein
MLVVASIWETITLSKIIVALLYFLAGLVLYTIFGAITGASVSKLDELQEAYKYYSIVMVLCVYADLFLVIMMLSSGASETLQNFCAIFPLTGAFLTPAFVLTGKVSIITGVIALIIIIITSAAAFVLSSAIYESMLLFQGKRLKVKDVVTLMKKQVVA